MLERFRALAREAYAKPAVTMADVQTRATIAAYWGDGRDSVKVGHICDGSGPIEGLDDELRHRQVRRTGRLGAEWLSAGLPSLAELEAAISADEEAGKMLDADGNQDSDTMDRGANILGQMTEKVWATPPNSPEVLRAHAIPCKILA